MRKALPSLAFLCAKLALKAALVQHTSYLDHWLAILQNDRSALLRAEAEAQQAYEYLYALVLEEADSMDNEAEARHHRSLAATATELDRFARLALPVPPLFGAALGYSGDARYVAFYWTPAGDEFMPRRAATRWTVVKAPATASSCAVRATTRSSSRAVRTGIGSIFLYGTMPTTARLSTSCSGARA